MGIVLSDRAFAKSNGFGLLKPIIYCFPYGSIAAVAVPINLLLAEKLARCKPNRRTMQIESFFNQILDQLSDDAIIKDFDVMFNPDYKVDILKIMVNACKRKPFSIIWPGKCEDGRLIYAEDSYPDFKTFNIAEYDVTCIIQGGKQQ